MYNIEANVDIFNYQPTFQDTIYGVVSSVFVTVNLSQIIQTTEFTILKIIMRLNNFIIMLRLVIKYQTPII